MVNGEDYLDGCDGTGSGEVKGGGVDLAVINSLLGEIPKDVMGERGMRQGLTKTIRTKTSILAAFGSMRLRPSLRRLKGSLLRGLVKISAMMSSEETFSIEMFPFWTLSRRK
ncbi:hypothetical protein Tco_1333937 [Tanacetum coccineum]